MMTDLPPFGVTPDIAAPWLAAALVGLVLLIALVRRGREAAALKSALARGEAALRDSIARAERAETLLYARDQQMDEMARTIADQRADIDALLADRRDLELALTQTEERSAGQIRAANEKLEQLQKLREEMGAQFRDLAACALKTQGEDLARAHVDQLKTTLSPLRAHVEIFGKELKTMQDATQKERIELRKEIEALTRQTAQVSQDAHALTRALRADQQKQGAWGEMVLQTVLEGSGLREGAEYTRQAARTGKAGTRLRPDVVVHIPGDKTLVIDSKVSLTAYTYLVNATDDAASAEAARRHLQSLRGHIDGLSKKAYHAAEENSVDYVILFVPIEGALSEALRLDGGLTTWALERHITIATPTTLMMALKTVKHVWDVDRRNRNAEEIARRAGFLYDKVAGFVANMDQVGQRLGQAQDSYEKAFGQLSRGPGNILGQVDTLKRLGARATKSIEADFDAEPDRSALESPVDQDASAPPAPRHSGTGQTV